MPALKTVHRLNITVIGSMQSVLCFNIHSTSLVLRLTVRTALFGLRVAGGSNGLKSPENSWLNSLSSISDAVDR